VLDTVVDLIDQIHGLRHQLGTLAQAIAQQPADIQRAIAASVRALDNRRS
jgi:ABC-type transporter Mla subunit MlaD